jgi:hypothetical protein
MQHTGEPQEPDSFIFGISFVQDKSLLNDAAFLLQEEKARRHVSSRRLRRIAL